MFIIDFFFFSFEPVSLTFFALITTTLSPQSKCGVKVVLCLPLSIIEILDANLPRTSPSALIRYHFFLISFVLNYMYSFNIFMKYRIKRNCHNK